MTSHPFTGDNPVKQRLNEIIHHYYSCRLCCTDEAKIPEDPTEWVIEHFLGMEVLPLAGVLVPLAMRGATPGMCARYVHDRDTEMPFIGFEQAVFHVVLDALLERGHGIPQIAQVIEILAIAIINAGHVFGAPSISPLCRMFTKTGHFDA